MTNLKRTHESVAKTLRYAGYEARLYNNKECAQPWEVRVKGISSEEQNEILDRVWSIYDNKMINVVPA